MKKHTSNQEFETTVLNINPEEIIEKLRALGAEEKPEVLFRRWVYDLHPTEMEILRLRDNGGKNTLTYKKRTSTEIGSTEEIEIEVSDFDKTAAILSKIKYYNNARYQEQKRHIFRLDDIEFAIDTWPKIPPYLEIESTSKEKVNQGLKLLGLEGKDSGDLDTHHIYLSYGIDLNSFDVFKFE